VKNIFVRAPLIDNFMSSLAQAVTTPADHGEENSEMPQFTVGQRLVFRPGDDRAAEMLRATPARELVVGAFALALADLDDDGHAELIVQRVTLPGITDGRSTMVLKKRKHRYVKLLDCKLGETLAVTNEKVGRFRALAELDDSGSIRFEHDSDDTGQSRQVVKPIPKNPKPVQ